MTTTTYSPEDRARGARIVRRFLGFLALLGLIAALVFLAVFFQRDIRCVEDNWPGWAQFVVLCQDARQSEALLGSSPDEDARGVGSQRIQQEPTEEPTAEPTVAPTEEPTAEPTEEPAEPTVAPTEEPVDPTEEPVEPAEDPVEEPAKVITGTLTAPVAPDGGDVTSSGMLQIPAEFAGTPDVWDVSVESDLVFYCPDEVIEDAPWPALRGQVGEPGGLLAQGFNRYGNLAIDSIGLQEGGWVVASMGAGTLHTTNAHLTLEKPSVERLNLVLIRGRLPDGDETTDLNSTVWASGYEESHILLAPIHGTPDGVCQVSSDELRAMVDLALGRQNSTHGNGGAENALDIHLFVWDPLGSGAVWELVYVADFDVFELLRSNIP